MPTPTANFAEIRAVAQALPPFDPIVQAEARGRLGPVEGDAGGLGDLALWLAAAQRRVPPQINRPRLALFAATHGIALDHPEGAATVLAGQIQILVDGGGALHRLVEAADADLRLYELALDQPCRDSRRGAAMDETEAARAVAYGMMAVEPGVDLLVISALGLGARLSAEAIQARAGAFDDPLALLAAAGGPDIAAMLGAILAARLAGVPIVLDGSAALASAAIARGLRADAAAHCRPVAADAASEMTPILGFGATPPLAGAATIALLRNAALLLA